jgi:hypothetical protein
MFWYLILHALCNFCSVIYASHIDHISCFVHVLLLGATPRIRYPDVYTPRVRVDQQGEGRHKNVSSGRLVHYVILFYYGSIATASYPPHAKCKILRSPRRPEVRLNSSFFSCFFSLFCHNSHCTISTLWDVCLHMGQYSPFCSTV